MGMLETPSFERVSAISILSSHVSPMPTMPPEHISRPAAFARARQDSFSSKVWVVHILGKFLLDVSILQ